MIHCFLFPLQNYKIRRNSSEAAKCKQLQVQDLNSGQHLVVYERNTSAIQYTGDIESQNN